jgi:hypothetical protein
MFACDLPIHRADDVVRLVRALGGHRYVDGRLLLVHALVFDAVAFARERELDAACAWAEGVLEDATLDASSRDPRLLRASTETELAVALSLLWGAGESRAQGERARQALAKRLASLELDVAEAEPFDEAAEDAIHPVLIDAGWQLLPLARLDAERHKGAIGAYDDALAFDVARFEEESALPKPTYLHELPAFGPKEILAGVNEDGELVTSFPLWVESAPFAEPYMDYVLRGVTKVAKLTDG